MAMNHYGSPLLITDSGGKDSAVCRELVRRFGVPHEIIHNLTTADAPQTIYYIRERFRLADEAGIRCSIQYPYYKGKRVTMWSLIPQKKIPPTRLARYCCEVLKEGSGVGRFITTGVRWAESKKRKEGRGIYEAFARNKDKKIILNNDNDDRRQLFESCQMKSKHICNPIIDWSDRDVWDYIHAERIPINPLYEMGFFRVGCVGCPMAGKQRYREFSILKYLVENFEYSLSISIDGAKETHDLKRRLKGGKGSFDVVIKNARRILERRKDVRVRMTVDSTTVNALFSNVCALNEEGFKLIVPGIDYTQCYNHSNNLA